MSSSRARLVNTQIITDGSMTGTDTITSDELDISNASSCAIEAVWTGTPNGTFTVEGCVNVTQALPPLGVTWQTITLSTTLSASGAAGNHLINMTDLAFTKLRLKYVNSSSTGTLNASATVKGS